MTETKPEYQISDKNQVKIAKAASALVSKLNDWLEGKTPQVNEDLRLKRTLIKGD